MGGVQGEAMYYMRDVLEVVQEQDRLVSGPRDVMFRTEDVGGMDWSWSGHAMRCMYLQGVYSTLREELM